VVFACGESIVIVVLFVNSYRVGGGFDAMQFNSVVYTNEVAVKLWQRLGFHITGTIPKAYKHAQLGLVDSYIMYKWLRT